MILRIANPSILQAASYPVRRIARADGYSDSWRVWVDGEELPFLLTSEGMDRCCDGWRVVAERQGEL